MEGLEAFALGGLAQSSLVLAGLVVYWVRPTTRVIGGLAGFGAGALVAAVAFDLVPQAGGHGALGDGAVAAGGCVDLRDSRKHRGEEIRRG